MGDSQDELERTAERVDQHRKHAGSPDELRHRLTSEFLAHEDEVFYRVLLLAAMPLYSQLEN